VRAAFSPGSSTKCRAERRDERSHRHTHSRRWCVVQCAVLSDFVVVAGVCVSAQNLRSWPLNKEEKTGALRGTHSLRLVSFSQVRGRQSISILRRVSPSHTAQPAQPARSRARVRACCRPRVPPCLPFFQKGIAFVARERARSLPLLHLFTSHGSPRAFHAKRGESKKRRKLLLQSRPLTIHAGYQIAGLARPFPVSAQEGERVAVASRLQPPNVRVEWGAQDRYDGDGDDEDPAALLAGAA